MILTPAVICIIAALVLTLLFDSWIRRRKGTGKENARIFAVVRGRLRNFWSYQYVPILVMLAVIAAAEGISLGIDQAGSFIAGAAVVLISVAAGAGTFPSGVTAAYEGAVNDDIKGSVRCGYRTGAVLGSVITAVCLAAFCVLFTIMKTRAVVNLSASFALGAAVAAMVLHTGGEVYTSAYSLAVPSNDFADRSGEYIGVGADISASYVISMCTVILLAEVGVETSGVTSTFTTGNAAKFPALIYACGIAGSLIGVFLQRAGIGGNLSKGASIGTITAGVITIAGSVYFSMDMLQSRVYAWAATTGIITGIVMMLTSRFFSPDGRLLLGRYTRDKGVGKYSAVPFNLGTGMVSSSLYALMFITAIAVSYMFANFYGIALCAAGLCSILGSVAAIEGLSAVAGSASGVIEAYSSDENAIAAGYSLDTVSVRNRIMIRSYSCIADYTAALAAFCAFFYVSGEHSVDLMNIRVFIGFMVGGAAAFMLAGILTGSVRITSRIALRDIGRNDDETGETSVVRGALVPSVVALAFPVVVGLLFGIQSLSGMIIGCITAAFILDACMVNSGRYYENTAIRSLSSLIKMTAVFSVVFIRVFMNSGGFLFR